MTKYIPERDYVKNGWKPVKKGPDDLCGSCEAYYKNLYDQKITKTPFPPSCSKHVLEPINKLKASDFESEEEFEFARISLDPVAWAAYELEWDLRWYQADVLSCTSQFKVLRQGRRCLAKGTMVATPTGPAAIETLRPGDNVYSEQGTIIKVKEVFDQGVQDVVDISHRNKILATCTLDHIWSTVKQHSKTRNIPHPGLRKTSQLDKYTLIDRVEIEAPLGTVDEPLSYVIGTLLGDGCCREHYLSISSAEPKLVASVAAQLGTTYRKNSPTNYTWNMPKENKAKIPYYFDWLHNKYAHEKIVDLSVIKTWNRQTLLKLIAGLIDTDGSVIKHFDSNGKLKEIAISLGMQAKSVMEAAQYSFLALWQVSTNLGIDNRAKYKNGPVWNITIKNIHQCKRILKELDQYLNVGSKKYDTAYDSLVPYNFNPKGMGGTLKNPRKEQCYDIHVDSPTNLYLLANGLVTHNSGKSNTLMVDALHFVSTNPGKTVLILAPYEPQVEKLFEELHMLINRSKTIKQSIVRDVKKPCMISFANGSHIKGLSAGSKNTTNRSDKIRGQDAHYIIIDEIDYIPDEDLVAITAILASHNDCKIAVCCTPTGEHARFFSYCVDKDQKFKEFHIIAQESPEWSATVEEFFLRDYGGKNTPAWDHEILAEFGKQEHGVFSNEKINSCLQDYSISAAAPKAGASYICGVDWNKNAGTHILIIETNGTLFKPVLKIIIPNSDFTQIEAVDKIIELYYHWNLSLIVVDVGYGSTQIELLKKHGLQNPQGGLHRRLKPIAMQEHIEIRDPQNGLVRRTPTKPFLVNCLKNELDEGKLILPKDEDTIETRKNATHGLVQQMRNFKIEGQSIYGVPKYSQGEDHTLTAFMLGVSGYVLEHSDLQKINFSTRVGIVSTSPENKATSAEQLAEKENLKKDPSAVPSRQLNKGSSLFGYSSKNGSSVIKQQKHIRTFGHGLAQNKPNSSFKRKSF